MRNKNGIIYVRTTDKRVELLKGYADVKGYSLTRVVEDLVDSLEEKLVKSKSKSKE